MNSLETNKLYKQQRKIEAQRQKVEETTRKYYEGIRAKQIAKIDQEINNKVQKMISKKTKKLDEKEKNLKRLLKGKEVKEKPMTTKQRIEKITRPLFAIAIKIRDSLRTTGTLKYCVCITSGKKLKTWDGKQIQAGHYQSRRNKSIMFNQYNVHGQSAGDNNWGLGESKIYREKLIELYGQEKVDYLDSQKNVPYKLDNDELYEIEQQSIIYIKDYVDEILSLDISGSLRIFLKKYIK